MASDKVRCIVPVMQLFNGVGLPNVSRHDSPQRTLTGQVRILHADNATSVRVSSPAPVRHMLWHTSTLPLPCSTPSTVPHTQGQFPLRFVRQEPQLQEVRLESPMLPRQERAGRKEGSPARPQSGRGVALAGTTSRCSSPDKDYVRAANASIPVALEQVALLDANSLQSRTKERLQNVERRVAARKRAADSSRSRAKRLADRTSSLQQSTQTDISFCPEHASMSVQSTRCSTNPEENSPYPSSVLASSSRSVQELMNSPPSLTGSWKGSLNGTPISPRSLAWNGTPTTSPRSLTGSFKGSLTGSVTLLQVVHSGDSRNGSPTVSPIQRCFTTSHCDSPITRAHSWSPAPPLRSLSWAPSLHGNWTHPTAANIIPAFPLAGNISERHRDSPLSVSRGVICNNEDTKERTPMGTPRREVVKFNQLMVVSPLDRQRRDVRPAPEQGWFAVPISMGESNNAQAGPGKSPNWEARQQHVRSVSSGPRLDGPPLSRRLQRCYRLYDDAAQRRVRREASRDKAEKKEQMMLTAMQTAMKQVLQGPTEDPRTHDERLAGFIQRQANFAQRKEAVLSEKVDAQMHEQQSLQQAELQECTFQPKRIAKGYSTPTAATSTPSCYSSPAELQLQDQLKDYLAELHEAMAQRTCELKIQEEDEIAKNRLRDELRKFCDAVQWSEMRRLMEYLCESGGQEYLKSRAEVLVAEGFANPEFATKQIVSLLLLETRDHIRKRALAALALNRDEIEAALNIDHTLPSEVRDDLLLAELVPMDDFIGSMMLSPELAQLTLNSGAEAGGKIVDSQPEAGALALVDKASSLTHSA